MFTSFDEFTQASLQNGAFYAIRKLKEETHISKKISFIESELNDLGYFFLNDMNRIEDAIEIFKFNISLFPESSNVYDSLGEAYFLKGDKWAALENYRQSLKLNPNNKNAQSMLRQIKFIQ